MANIQPTLLWLAWRNAEDDKIRDDPPPVPRQSSNPPQFRRNLAETYQLSLYLSLAERILAAQSITMRNVKRAVRYLRMFCQGALRLGHHLVPNNHIAMHYDIIFRLFGPAYAWWLFAFERFNGFMKQVNINGHADGEMELSLLRDWIQKQRLHELVCILSIRISYN